MSVMRSHLRYISTMANSINSRSALSYMLRASLLHRDTKRITPCFSRCITRPFHAAVTKTLFPICKKLTNGILDKRVTFLPSAYCRGKFLSSAAQAQKVLVNGQEIVQIGPHNAAQILEKYDSILLDCDGVVWGMDHVTHIPGAAQAVTCMQALGKQVLFVTNNSMHGRQAYVRKFREYGFDAPADDVFCVAYASAVYLHEILQVHTRGSVYIIGTEGMAQELDDIGVAHFGVGSDPDPVYGVIPDLLHVPLRDDVSAVLVGYDKHFNLNKLFKACSYLENKDCTFLATSDLEKSVFIAPGRRQPLTGAIVDAVKSAAKRAPIIVGKPDAHLFACIKATHPSLYPTRTLMIGDSVPGDIGFAKAAGLDSALVLTGSSNLDTISRYPGLEPEYFLSSLAAFNL